MKKNTRPVPKTTDHLLSTADVASSLSVSVRTVWRMLLRGEIPQPDLRIGRKLTRWKASTVEAWLAGLGGAKDGYSLPMYRG